MQLTQEQAVPFMASIIGQSDVTGDDLKNIMKSYGIQVENQMIDQANMLYLQRQANQASGNRYNNNSLDINEDVELEVAEALFAYNEGGSLGIPEETINAQRKARQEAHSAGLDELKAAYQERMNDAMATMDYTLINQVDAEATSDGYKFNVVNDEHGAIADIRIE